MEWQRSSGLNYEELGLYCPRESGRFGSLGLLLVSARRAAGRFSKHSSKVACIVKAHRRGDLGDAFVAQDQQFFSLLDAETVQIVP